MEKYVTNSKKSKEVPAEVQPTKPAVRESKKESEITKILGWFLSENLSGRDIIEEIIKPSIKSFLLDSTIKIAKRCFSSGNRPSGTTSSSIKPTYSRMYNAESRVPFEEDRPRYSGGYVRSNSIYAFENLTFEDKADAENVLHSLIDIVERDEFVTVARFYELSGQKGKYTDARYGWTNLNGVDIVEDDGGWYIKFPRIQPIT